MGHYASEMDPSWGQPTPTPTDCGYGIGEPLVDQLMNDLYSRFGPFDRGRASKIAQAIDQYVKARITQALGEQRSHNSCPCSMRIG